MTRTESTPRIGRTTAVLVLGLVLAAAGVLGLYLTGVPGFPVVPPGPIILGVTAAVVALVPGRWTVALGLLVALALTVGAVLSGVTLALLTGPAPIGQFLAAVLQTVGLLVALVAGVASLVRGRPA